MVSIITISKNGFNNNYIRNGFNNNNIKNSNIKNDLLQISVNGYVTFELGLVSWLPAKFPHSSLPSFFRFLPMIAPFWADIDLRQTPGKVLYHVYSRELLDPSYEYIMPRDKLVFDWVTDQIWTNVGDYGFLPTMVVVVTWQKVSPYPGYKTNNEVACRFIGASL